MVIDNMFAILLTVTWGIEMFLEKEGAAEYRVGCFEIRGWGTCCVLLLTIEENFM